MKRFLFAATMLLGACAGSASCSSSERVNLASAPPPAAPPSFTNPNNVDASSFSEGGGPRLECIATECPEPWETCNSAETPTFKCATDISRDNDNCGACGNKCTDYLPINMTSSCVSGACALQCYKHYSGITNVFEDWTDCNGLVEDGCERNLSNDPDHCGACGNACAEGVPCFGGKCGCSAPFILCNGKCVDPSLDDLNCGECGHACEPPADACSPLQAYTAYGCVGGACGGKKCTVDEYRIQHYDCNKDLFTNTCSGDGCEVAGLDTMENCGKCGNKCTGDQKCVNEGNGLECAVPCARSGKVSCGSECVDLLTDRDNCGTCGHRCRILGEDVALKQSASCEQGMCVYACDPGFGDCNGDPRDGCEADLRHDPRNCGGCGTACDVAAGQPCIEAKCLMKECDAGVPN